MAFSFNTYPAMHVKHVDLGKVYATVEAIKGARNRNALLERQMQRDKELGELRKRILAPRDASNATVDEVPAANAMTAFEAMDLHPGPTPHGGPTQEAADALMPAQNGASVDNGLLLQYATLDPKGAGQLVDMLGKMDDRQREQMSRANDATARLLLGVEEVARNGGDTQAAYEGALMEAVRMGIPVGNTPEKWDPVWARTQVMKTMTVKEILAQNAPQPGFRRAAAGGQEPIPGGPADPAYLRRKSKAQQKPKADPNNIREAQILVQKGLYPDFKSAYEAVTKAGGGPFEGTSLDAQTMNILLKGDPSSPEYRAAYAHYGRPKVSFDPATGKQITVQPDMSPFRAPGAPSAQAGRISTSLPPGGATQKDTPPGEPQNALSGVFDAEGDGFDMARAEATGMQPAGPEAGENEGHFGSVAPVSPEEQQQFGVPAGSYILLKGRNHPTFHLAVQAEQARGFQVVKRGDRYFSVPGDASARSEAPSDVTGGVSVKSVPGAPARFNDTQGKAAGFADRMASANTILDKLEQKGTELWDQFASKKLPLGNYLVDKDFQKYDQARRDFINAQLRRESGAVISDEEFENAERQYFPQPGDSAEVIAQKRKARQIALEAMRRDAGPAYDPQGFDDTSDLPTGVTEEDVQFTMKKHGLTREEVLRRAR